MKTKWLVSFTAQKMNLPLRASSENVTKSEKKKKTGDLVISTGEILKDTLKAFGDFKNKQKSV